MWIAAVSGFIFVGVSLLALGLSVLLTRDSRQAKARLRGLLGPAEQAPAAAGLKERALAKLQLPNVGAALLPRDEAQRTRLQQRLIEAGIYDPGALHVFLGAKVLLLSLGTAAGLA